MPNLVMKKATREIVYSQKVQFSPAMTQFKFDSSEIKTELSQFEYVSVILIYQLVILLDRCASLMCTQCTEYKFDFSHTETKHDYRHFICVHSLYVDFAKKHSCEFLIPSIVIINR